MEQCRRLQKNNERYLENSEVIAKICFIRICLPNQDNLVFKSVRIISFYMTHSAQKHSLIQS